MNVVYWRMVNGGMGSYMNGAGLGSLAPASPATPALSALPSAAPAPGLTLPAASYYPGTFLSSPSSPAVSSPHSSLLPKWVLPEWSVQQLQYMVSI